ncbi:thiol-disulfide oxidoreductase DCC family protein [Paenibacillus guangzhouensis]|uniref:thiol-disulfide oxidoreductase DCC family protein n=1 Tax=Paenibacillus guangzhouensis TaxID=1473112 RepID=UPI001267592A|nr:thiol-disulfide oxidoreductase DCC family protein [Paenibacillus guangzhouensis]
MTPNPKAIILFDGVCNFCNSSVQFIIRRDKNSYFSFASLQSETGMRLLREQGYAGELSSVVVIDQGQLYTKSDAALRIAKQFHGIWRSASVLRIVPRPLRDLVYNFVAKNRYRWFGKSDSCMLPSPEVRSRFLD